LRIGNRLIPGSLLVLDDDKATPLHDCSAAHLAVTGCPGIRDRIKSEWLTGCYRNR
jgi:hypothetical protein